MLTKLKNYTKNAAELLTYYFRSLSHARDLTLIQDNTTKLNDKKFILFATLRNESERIPFFLDYYRQLGVEHFIFVDNNSTDNFQHLVSTEQDVTVYHIKTSYKNSNSCMHWLNYLLRKYGSDKLCLICDTEKTNIRNKINYLGFKKHVNMKIDNNHVNVHFGVHKTATTYIQDHLSRIQSDELDYIPLDKGRNLIYQSSMNNYLDHIDFTRKVIISDENFAGQAVNIKTGKIYPNIQKRSEEIISRFLNKDLVQVFISIRPICDYLPSYYCEYLRHQKFIDFKSFTQNIDVLSLQWFDVLHGLISNNGDISFNIIDFTNFSENINNILQQISFGYVSTPNSQIKPSRSSFTYHEIYELSEGQESISKYCNNHNKFRPFTESECMVMRDNYSKDLSNLAKLPNVKIL